MAVVSPTSPSPDLAPRLHLQAPTHLLHILEEFDEGVRLDAPNTALRAMRQAFAFLLGLSADLIGSYCVLHGASADLYILEEGQRYRPEDAETRLREGLHYLSERVSTPIATELTGLFFEGSGNPKQYYRLTQGGRVEGMAGGLYRISEFVQEPRRAPGRSEAFKLRNAYLPHLESWLQALGQVLSHGERVWEHTALDGSQRILYRLGGESIEIGGRLDLHQCPACVPSRVLQAPSDWVRGDSYVGIPQNVPEHTLHLADRFGEHLKLADTVEATRLLRDSLEFLLRYFAGIGKTLAQELQCLSSDAEKVAQGTDSVDNCERLLQITVDSLKSHQDDIAARDFVSVFYRRDANLHLQPRSHTNILLLEGVLSSWFKQERGRAPSAERYAKDFERYYPLFRDWVGSMGPFFSHVEHFEETPTDEGQLPLTVRCGEHLLELMGDEYFLKIRQCPVCLPTPRWVREAAIDAKAKALQGVTSTLTATELLKRANEKPEAEKPVEPAKPAEPEVIPTFPGEFRPIEIPSDAPKYFGRILRRLDVRLRRGELPESRAALRDALDYLLRYWAGVCWACAKEAGKLDASEEKMASQSLSIQECERLLTATLKNLAQGVNELSEEIVQVFYEQDLFSEELKPLGGHTRMLQTDANNDNQMQLLADFCENREDTPLNQSRRDLKTFLPVLRDWLTRSQGFFEQCQHHEEEPDLKGRMELVVQWDKEYLELVAPDYAFYVTLGSDAVPDLPVPEWVEPIEPVKPTESQKVKIITTEELALSEPFLIHKVQFVGVRPNSEGVACKSGIISIQNAGGGSLTGRAFATHPCIEVSPNRFREKTQLTYWLDESKVPRDFIPTLVLRSGGDERQITLAEMRPLSKFSTLSQSQGKVMMWSPVVFGFFLTNGAIAYRASKLDQLLRGTTLPLKQTAPDVLATCLEQGNGIANPFLLYACAGPLLTLAIYRRYSHSLQSLLDKQLTSVLSAFIPALIVVAGLNAVVFRSIGLAEVTNTNLLRLLPWGIALAVLTATYSYAEIHHKIAEWISEPVLRKLVPPLLGAAIILIWTLSLA